MVRQKHYGGEVRVWRSKVACLNHSQEGERERERETPHILDTVPRTPPTVAYFLR
jgi:hypothetical protein